MQRVLAALFVLIGIATGAVADRPRPEGVSASDWTGILAAHEAARHVVSPSESGHVAHNPGQGWTIRFDGRGFEAAPDGGGWAWGLDLQSWGRDVEVCAEDTRARVETMGGRVEYLWSEHLTEWYINDSRGLEHGFTVKQRPEGRGPLRLTLSVRGNLVPRVSGDGRDVVFVDRSGGATVNYAGLKVFDARGESVPARFETSESRRRLTLTVDDQGVVYPLTIDPIAQEAYLKASNTDIADLFGASIAFSGDTVVVGAHFEDSNATGVNGNQADNTASVSGAAYVFVRNAGTWTQQAYLKASNTGVSDAFGVSVAISGDTVVVGADGEDSNATGVNGNQADNSASAAGAAYVFVRSGGTWTQQAYLKASNTGAFDFFGCSVAVCGDTVVIGAFAEESSATGVNGNQADNSASDSGAAYVFVRTGGTWIQQAYFKASNTEANDQFGSRVAVSGDTAGVWARFEDSNATGVNGNQADNSAGSSGAVYVFERTGGTWTQQAYLKASNTGATDGFGSSVALSGDTVVVGARFEDSNATGVNGNHADNSASDSGAAYVFVRSGGTWTQQAYLKASNTGANDGFASSVAVFGDTVVVGANGEDSNATGINGNQADNSASDSGAAYVFARSGGTWTQRSYLKAANTGASDAFGRSVAVSGDTVVVGADGEDSNATGVNGNQADDSAAGSGAAYVFQVSCDADFNESGSVTVQDLFDFLAAWFARTINADFNSSGAVTVQDLFDFLSAWFVPCP